jgi:tetratricopeptide (TPR) repeat protein
MTSSRILLCAAALLVAGCGAKRSTAYLTDAAAAGGGEVETLEGQAMAAWDAREDTASLKEALELYEKLVDEDPTDRTSMEMLSRGYYLLAGGHLEDPEEKLAAYDAGASWGERILGLSDDFRACVEAGAKDYECLDHATKIDVPGIYWAYANQGKWAVGMGFATVLKHKSKLHAFISRVAELDSEYYYGAADRGLGAYYAKAPSFAGGDLDLALEHFEKSLAVAPDYIGTRVLMAEYWAVKSQDKEAFDRLLDEALAIDAAVYPDVIPIQKLGLIDAQKLKDAGDDLFE